MAIISTWNLVSGRSIPLKAIRNALGSLLFVAFLAGASTAQVQRTFISGLGSDGNNCSRTAPCRTFAQALSLTNAGGEVYVLDTSGYGPINITQPVSVVSPPGVTAGISVFSGDGIDVNVGVNDTVTLRGLTINNQGSSGNGIVFGAGGTLHVEGCVVSGFAILGNAGGIRSLAGPIAGAAHLEIKDSIFKGNGIGIDVRPASGTVWATIDHVRLEGSGLLGLIAGDAARVTISNSVVSAGAGGLEALSETAASADLNIENCVVSNNTSSGILAESDSTGVARIRVSNSTVINNFAGLVNVGAPAVLLTRSNNTVEGNTNGGNESGTIGSYSAK